MSPSRFQTCTPQASSGPSKRYPCVCSYVAMKGKSLATFLGKIIIRVFYMQSAWPSQADEFFAQPEEEQGWNSKETQCQAGQEASHSKGKSHQKRRKTQQKGFARNSHKVLCQYLNVMVLCRKFQFAERRIFDL